jgi:hypothetical protein
LLITDYIVEHIVELVQFVLLALLGFMPLIIIYWAYHRPRFRVPHLKRHALRLAVAARAAVVVMVAHITSHTRLF